MGDMNYQVCTHWNIGDLLRMQRGSQLTPPAEFQRGPKWSTSQKKLYIDSLLRGYPSPAFYFHCDQPEVVIRRNTLLNFGVIDGQQRLNAMKEFVGGAWSLLKSPDTAPGGSKHFPVETIQDPAPEWCGLRYRDFSDRLKMRFVSLTLPVIVVKTTALEVVRDLFIRLQAGTALSAQERRDAWPGKFPEYIKHVGGHPHGGKGLKVFDAYTRGKDDAHRRVAAQAFLAWSHWTATGGDLPEISSQRLDDLYRQRIGFEDDTTEARQLKLLLTALGRALKPRKGKWPEWMVLHMTVLLEELDRREVLTLTDILRTRSVAGDLGNQMLAFADQIADSTDDAKSGVWSNADSQRTYLEFAQYVLHDATASGSLRLRHRFLRQWFWERLLDVSPPADDLPPPRWSAHDDEEDELNPGV